MHAYNKKKIQELCVLINGGKSLQQLKIKLEKSRNKK